ncbi:MAG: gliding motility lipoprotein GldD [Flavobacteriaceae bacterium]|nr:gliding motility lipoprotein GldD [Bacteroidia bacterium]NNK83119.1 gliding motility lipoprotein GldD [Flavobacteriaceae bacterium]
MKKVITICFLVFMFACGEEHLPKPKAFLRLDYPKPEYYQVETNLPFTFEKNKLAVDVYKVKTTASGTSQSIDLEYHKLKGTIYLTYKKVLKNNLNTYLLDAQNITQKHTIKADEIVEQPFINAKEMVYGMFYEVGGNAASQSQFYLTDSINHFVTGSLYFYVKPNYDSILPAADYLKNDIRHIMESLKWKE